MRKLLLIPLLFLIGCTPEYVEVPPETVTVTETITAPPADARTVFVPKIEYVDRVSYVEIPAEVEKIVTVNQTIYSDNLTAFETLQELRGFLKADPTDHQLFVVSGEVLNKQCENRAFQLRENAALIGKRLETEVLTSAEYLKYYDKRIQSLHMICKAIIGNDGYYIEPSTDKVWKGFVLD